MPHNNRNMNALADSVGISRKAHAAPAAPHINCSETVD